MIGAVDIGGTKTLVAVFDHSGKIVEQEKFATSQNYNEFLQNLQGVVAKLATKDFAAFAVAAPGRIDRKQGLAVGSSNISWHNAALVADLERIFKSPGLIENDAKTAAVSEARLLEKKYSKVLYVTISTGIGCGLIVDGLLDPRFHDIEIGNVLLEHHGKLQRWEDFASGKAIVKRFGKKASEITDQPTWRIISRNLALGLIDAIATLTPDIIIIGGGVGSHFHKFNTLLVDYLNEYDNPVITIPPIVQAKHPEEAVIYGCYELAKERYGRNSK